MSVETDPSTWALTYREVADGVVGPAQKVRSGTKTDFPKLFVWSLVFDDACRPVVMWSSGAQGYRQYTPGSPHWTSVEVPFDLAGAVGTATHHSSVLSADGHWHLVANGTVGGKSALIVGTLGGGRWSFRSLPYFGVGAPIREVFQYQIGPDRSVHVVYSSDRHLHYARCDSSACTQEVVKERDDMDSEPAHSASLALNAAGEPFIAAFHLQRVATGSFLWGHLRYYERKNGVWQHQVVSEESAGYAGGDGVRYTGDHPHLIIDTAGRPHISFEDMSSWHKAGRNEYMSGQIRHAVRAGHGAWCVETVYSQAGQSASPNELHDLLYPIMALSPDGDALSFLGIERTAAGPTFMYDLAVTITYRLTWFSAKLR